MRLFKSKFEDFLSSELINYEMDDNEFFTAFPRIIKKDDGDLSFLYQEENIIKENQILNSELK